MQRQQAIIGLTIALGIAVTATAQQERHIPAVQQINGLSVKPSTFKVGGHSKPIVLHSKADAAAHFKADDLAKLTKQVDFAKQAVLLYAWRGSGQDKIEVMVMESYPEQLRFNYVRGRTRDLRPHVAVFAVRSNVRYPGKHDKPAAKPDAKPAQYIKVEVKGKLNSQSWPSAGTTGIIITANNITWELDPGASQALRRQAQALHGKTVIARGQLRAKRGVEIRQRWIVTLTSLTDGATVKPGDAKSYLTEDGLLKHDLVLRDGQYGFAGETGTLWTIKTNGQFVRQTILVEVQDKPTGKGQLSKKQLAALDDLLRQADLAGLPKTIGENRGANPHIYRITFGKHQTVLRLGAGDPLPKADANNADKPAQRFAAIARYLQQKLQPPARE